MASTANYGWVKPVVGGDLNVWGAELNTDLDGIDSTVHGVAINFSATAPAMNGTAAPGSATTFAHSDHVHPIDTSRYAASNPSGYQTAAQVTASLGTYVPLAGATMSGGLNFPTAAGPINFATPAGGGQSWGPRFTGPDFATSIFGSLSFNNSTSVMTLNNNAAASAMYLNGDGSFQVTSTTAYKPAGGSWTAPSDARIKTVEGEYAKGLDEVLTLRPVEFTYKGNDTRAEGEPSPHAALAESGQRFIGLIAQEVEPVFPEMVAQKAGFIDGAAVNDLRDLDTTPLTFALINAVKELSNRVVALEAQLASR